MSQYCTCPDWEACGCTESYSGEDPHCQNCCQSLSPEQVKESVDRGDILQPKDL